MKNFKKSLLFILLVTFLLGTSVLVGCRNPFMENIVPETPIENPDNTDNPENPSENPDGGNQDSENQGGGNQNGGNQDSENQGGEDNGSDDIVDGEGTEAVVPPPATGNYSAVDSDKWATANYKLGATVVGSDVEFAVYSKNATKILLEIYEAAYGEDAKYTYWMAKGSDDIWRAKVGGIGAGTLYAFRAWGPNWEYSDEWNRGNSSAGYKKDYDASGNRFNPNKVLFDPYAKEISHDKSHPDVLAMVTGGTGSDGSSNPAVIYSTGEANKVNGMASRYFDTGKYAPKAVVVVDNTLTGTKPNIPQEKAIIYEAHVRGITKHESSASLSSILAGIDGFENITLEVIPDNERGTYAGAAKLAPYLKALGVNTIELLPVHESDNDGNPDDRHGGNYWAYMTYGYFAPDRRYSSDKSLGGPTREFKEMVKAFHDAEMEVYLDVVFNHSGEGGTWYGDTDNFNTAELTFMRGLDNSSWYCVTSSAPGAYWETTGCGNNLQCDNPMVGQMVLDSLTYWIDEMGVDGYRFDLAPVVGREFDGSNWNYNPNSQLLKDIATLGAKRKAEMIAEAWDIGAYGVGTFPAGWGEWNGRYRDAVRSYVGTGNRGSVNDFINGDYNNFNDQGGPHKSVNFIVAHDGFTLADLCSYEGAGNAQNGTLTWPFGPSDGGNGDQNTLGFGHEQDAKRQANRNYIAIQMMSRGVPMIVWGDEFSRTQNGNNNPYNIDSVATWSNYNMINTKSPHLVATGGSGSYHNNFGTFNNSSNVNGNFMFMKYMLNLKANEPALNQPDYGVGYDFRKEDGTSELTDGDKCVWLRINGSGVTGTDSEGNTVQGSDYLVFMNMHTEQISFALPKDNGEIWSLIADTQSYFETNFNYWNENNVMSESSYGVQPWSVVILKNIGKGTTSTPMIEYEANANSKTMEVTINCSTEGATIYYKQEDSGEYQVYNGPFTLNVSTAKTITAYATKAEFTKSPEISKTLFIDVYNIYCKPSFSGTPYAYVWKADGGSLNTWPGDAMKSIGDGWYELEVVDVNEGYDSVIFNDGSGADDKKTADLTFDKSKPYFKMTGSFTGDWVANKNDSGNNNPGNTDNNNPGGNTGTTKTLLFTRPSDDWGYHVYAYFFDDSKKGYSGDWPGTKMTWVDYNEYKQGQFSITVPAGATKLVIAGYNYEDDTCINQTVDITLADVTGYYVTEKNSEGKWNVVSW